MRKLNYKGIERLLARHSLVRIAACITIVIIFSSQTASGQTPEQFLQSQLGQQRQTPGTAQSGPAVLPDIVIQPVQAESFPSLPSSRLEQIISSRAGLRLEQFGYNQVGSGRSIRVPQTGAVQDNYVIGPGDEINISLRGQENTELRVLVDRNGQIVLPRLRPITAAGRSFATFSRELETAVSKAYVATSAFVSVGRMRQISVLVTGEVNYPGQRLVTGLSSALDALLLSGGVKKTGSLRNIRLVRGTREQVVDLYSILTNRSGSADVRLADGDRIVVPLLGRTVAVAGLVRRPGIYELSSGQSSIPIKSAKALAGGEEVRGRYRHSVLSIASNGASEMIPVPSEEGLLRDGDVLFVQLGADRTSRQATLAGSSGLAGSYPIVSGTRLSDLIKAPGALGTSPYTPFGVILRKDSSTLMPVLLPFTPAAVLTGREDQTLHSDDVVRFLSISEAHLLTFIVQTYLEGLASQQSAIRNPAVKTGQNLEVFNVGSVPANIQRQQIIGLLNLAAPGSSLAQQQNDQLRAQQQAAQQTALDQQLNSRNGQSSQESRLDAAPARAPTVGASLGTDLNSNFGPARNFTEQSVEGDRFASNREVQTFGQLARQLGIDPLILINFLVDQRVRLDGAIRGAGNYLVGPNVLLKDVVQAAGGTVNWANQNGVELVSTVIDAQTGRAVTTQKVLPLRESTLSNYVVKPHDQIRFSPIFSDVGVGSVTIQGEARSPGTFPIRRGEHLSDLIARAGGLTDVAYPLGVVFLRQSAAQREREGFLRAADEVQNQMVAAMTRVGNSKLEPNTFSSMQAFISELRSQPAVGRISVTADPGILAANPSLDPMLEAGDVIFIPQRPTTISVLGQVLQPGSYTYLPDATIHSYIEKAGGYSSTADNDHTFVIFPDGSARRVRKSWLYFSADDLPPGSTIVVPRDIMPFDLRQTIVDVSQILSQLAISIASVAILSK